MPRPSKRQAAGLFEDTDAYGMKSSESPKMKLRDLLRLMTFYRAMHSDVPTGTLLKIAGFKIAGLAGEKLAKLTSLGHKFCWNDYLATGICACGQWEADEKWTKELAQAQHRMHVRKANLPRPDEIGYV